MKSLKLLLLPAGLYLFSFSIPSIPPGATLQPKVHTVEIRQMKFSPAVLEVSKGDSIIFINKDLVSHDVTEISGKSWKSPALAPGDSWEKAVTKTASYYCSFHPVMKGKILVK
jgi:plastocyanin